MEYHFAEKFEVKPILECFQACMQFPTQEINKLVWFCSRIVYHNNRDEMMLLRMMNESVVFHTILLSLYILQCEWDRFDSRWFCLGVIKKEEIQQKLSIYIFTGNGMRTERVHRHPIIILTLCITLFSSKWKFEGKCKEAWGNRSNRNNNKKNDNNMEFHFFCVALCLLSAGKCVALCLSLYEKNTSGLRHM